MALSLPTGTQLPRLDKQQLFGCACTDTSKQLQAELTLLSIDAQILLSAVFSPVWVSNKNTSDPGEVIFQKLYGKIQRDSYEFGPRKP